MSKTMKVGKFSLWAIISAAVIAVGIVVAAIFGFNPASSVSDTKTLSVRLFSTSLNSPKVDAVREICERELDNAGLNDAYTLDSKISGDSEVIYVFSAGASEEKLQSAKTAIELALESAKNTEGDKLYGSFLYATANVQKAKATLPSGYVWRAALAGVVAVILEFIYVSIRYRLDMGIAASVSTLVGTALTVSLVAILRIPTTTALAYVGAFALLYTTVSSLIVLSKMRGNFKTDAFKEKTAEEAVASSVPVGSVSAFAGICAAAILLIGAVSFSAVGWFAVASLVGVVAGTYASLVFLPAAYLPLKKASDKRAAERARYDYKKGAKKNKSKSEKSDSEPTEKTSSEA